MSSKVPSLTSGKQAWRLIQANTKAAAKRRAAYDDMFANLFPEGHAHSLRPLAQELALNPDNERRTSESFYSFLKAIHPEAFSVIAAYGVDYVPQPFEENVYHSTLQPKQGECYRNATLLLHSFNTNEHPSIRSMTYVEGLAFGASANPMLHAWNARLDEAFGIDWTFYAGTSWIRYLGVPFTYEEHSSLTKVVCPGRIVTSFFHRELFAKARPYIMEILEQRTPFQETPAA